MTRSITSSAYSSLIRRTADKLDTALPAKFDAALDEARAIREATDRIEGSAVAVNAHIITCLRNGKDWRTDTELQALMFERVAAANGIRQAGIDAAEDMVTTAVAQHADAIIGAWANSLEPDTAALAEAAEKITIADLAAADVPDLSRRKLVAVWAKARTAVERFKIAIEGWRIVATATALPRSSDHELFALTDTAPDGVTLGRDIDVWALARAGAPLSLATPSEYHQRVHRHEAMLCEQQLAADEQREHDRKAALR